jgi:hypothetical protein
MTNREALEAHKDRIVELFRKAVRAKIEQWEAEDDIEGLIGEIDGTGAALENYAACCSLPDDVATMFSEKEILDTVRELMQAPDDQVFSPPEE